MFYTEWVALNWLYEERQVKPEDIFHGSEFTDPTFVYNGNVGYEIKRLNGKTITFIHGKYDELKENWQHGEVLVFQPKSEEPYLIIPFSDLPNNGGRIEDVRILLLDKSTSERSMIAVSADEKEILEVIRSIVETKSIPQKDWGDMVVQSFCAMLRDQSLIKSVIAKRIGTKFFVAECPYCDNATNQLDIGNKLYWLQKCAKCGREFVAKRALEHKILT